MALTTEQIAAVSYPFVMKEMLHAKNYGMFVPCDHDPEVALKKDEPKMITVAQIFDTAYLPALEAIAGKRSWPTQYLEDAYQKDRISIEPWPINLTKPEVMCINTPVTWSKGQEAVQASEKARIDLARALIENVIDCHAYQLEEQLKKFKRLIVFQGYRFNLVKDALIPLSVNTSLQNYRLVQTHYLGEGAL